MRAMLRVEGVGTSLGGRTILEEVSFRVEPRQIVAVTGKSGSGKSTLLGIISGLLEPDSGTVVFDGQDIFRWGDYRRSRYRNREIGFVFQFFNLLPNMNSYQNIVYPAILSMSSRDLKKEVDYLVDYLQLNKIIHQYPATLSGGERQRVAIARAVINNPRLILADEPTGNLDDETSKDIISLFEKLKEKKGISFIVVTHDGRIVRDADRHFHLEDSRLSLVAAPGGRTRKRK
jgi:ABC-type lipoprotein export system ATPase subunit